MCQKERVRIDDFARYRYVNNVRVTPDGKTLVYSIIDPSLCENRYCNDLYTMDLASGAQRRLTSSTREGHFDFMDDGSVLFVSKRAAQKPADRTWNAGENPTQADVAREVTERAGTDLAEEANRGTDLYRIALDGGEAQLFCHLPVEVKTWKLLPGGSLLVLGRDLADTSSAYAVCQEIPIWWNGDTYTSRRRWSLYVVEFEGEAPFSPGVRKLTGELEDVESFDLLPGGEEVAVTSTTFEAARPQVTDLTVRNVATGAVRKLGPSDLDLEFVNVIDGKGTLAVWGTDMVPYGVVQSRHVYLVNADGSDFRKVTDGTFDVDQHYCLGSDVRQGGGQGMAAADGKVFFCNCDDDRSVVTSVDAQGNHPIVLGGAGSVDSFDTLDGKTFYYVALRPGMQPEISRATLAEGEQACPGNEERLTNFSEVLDNVDVVSPEIFTFHSNGADIKGYVVKPVGYDPQKTYPGILWVHGGPKTTMGDVFHHEIQYLSGLGYFVFYTNPHGSGSHGIEYAGAIFGKYGQPDFEDLMAFTDEVLERYPQIDRERVAEMGGSYGGFMTNWIIGHTDRFRCCNSQRSISNWVSKIGTSDCGYYFNADQTRGWLWDEDYDMLPFALGGVERLWDQSPLKYADKVKTPTLFLQSDSDYRCPLEQAQQMFTALRLHGVPAKLVVFKGENHDLSRSGKPQARVRRLVEIANWYGQWLKDDPLGEPSLR